MFELDKILTQIQEKRKIQFPLNEACFLMVIQHLLEPRSKLGTYHHQNRYFNLPPVELHHLYRSLDILCDHKEELEERSFINREAYSICR